MQQQYFFNLYIFFLSSSFFLLGARCNSVLERSVIVRWVVGSILHRGPIELFLVTTSDP